MDDSVRDRLFAAINTGEVLSVRYHGGSQPGSARELIPLQISDTKAKCRCYTSGAVKDFLISKIEILPAPLRTEGIEAVIWEAGRQNKSQFQTIQEVDERFRKELVALGWHVFLEEDGNGTYLALFEAFKNGKLRRNPTIRLTFERETWDIVVEPNGRFGRANLRPRARPWGVEHKSSSGGTWKDAHKAVEAFLQLAGVS